MYAPDEEGQSVLKHLKTAEKVAAFSVLAVLLVCAGLDWCDYAPYERFKGWLIALGGAVVLYAFVPALVRCGMSGGARSVWSVVRASLALLLVTLASFYSSYYLISASMGPGAAELSDRYLNFPPAIAALWTAGMGWYIHFQATSKNHRTNNSFNLIMQTRTSSEFLKKAHAVQMVYPFGSKIGPEDVDYFSSGAMLQLQRQGLASLTVEEGGATLETLLREEKVNAIEGVKYLLNYYEFMAVGIEANDLEESMLYNTISTTVCSMRERAEVYVSHLRENGQPLCFTTLDRLVKRWNERLEDEKHAQAKARL